MDWLVGDLQGCCDPFERLLAEIGFSPSRDRLWVLGDLVNRGPCSLATLERLRALGDAATCLLGNHDWHLLAAAYGVRPQHRTDTFDDILRSPQRQAWLEWLRERPMMAEAHGWLLVHAGLAPQWDTVLATALARELEQALRNEPLAELLPGLFGNEPARWRDDLDRDARLRFTLNALTRIRYVHADGTLDFRHKEGRGPAPRGLHRWFDVPERRSASARIAFGHWSTLGLLDRDDILGLDTGCVWGGRLTAVRVDEGRREVVQVECDGAQEID